MRLLMPESSGMAKKMTAESVMLAAKQSSRCDVVPVRLRSAIQGYLREQQVGHMKKKVLRLRESFNHIKEFNRLLPQSVSKAMVEDPLGIEKSQRWKIKSSYGDTGLTYRDDNTAAYIASRMPSAFAACFRVLREVRTRLPGFSPAKVLDFGSGTGSAFWALREVWPRSLEHVNLIEPSQSMQRAGFGLLQDVKNIPLIHSYGSILSFTKKVRKPERQHDLVIASYVLGEIPSAKDRLSIVRQLWGLTRDILVLIEPGTPEGSHIITQMRSHILWMEKRKTRKRKGLADGNSSEASRDGAFIIAPCPHDGPCPLVNTGTYCHFVQRLQRTESQLAYKRSSGAPRGFEDEKFSYVVFQRGKRPQEPWPLDDIKFETLKEMKANRQPEDLEIDYEDQLEDQSDSDEIVPNEVSLVPIEVSPSCDSSATEADAVDEFKEEVEERGHADLGSGWGRIIFMPQKRGRCVEMDVCRATKRDGSEGAFEHLAITRGRNPALHRQARKSIWGDLWPF
ncbi:rsm22-cox11 tandem protein 2, mitochondrial [Silene latifolia]|uniref:rsm22-cox11 tandem protein 2, mitochondrial n=1 Tax=Silene latifolia TaxID=37657 RepID=UPI003D784D66